MPSRGFYLVVRGPLGAGKTTIARRLARQLRGRYVAIDRILEAHDLEQWKDGYISEASFLRANEFAARSAARLLGRGVPVVVDGNFYWPRAVDDLLTRLPYPHAVLTLKLPIEECLVRDAGRARSFGAGAVRDVFRKVTAFERGYAVNARGTIGEVVDRSLAAARRAGLDLPRTGDATPVRSRASRPRTRSSRRTSPARPRPSRERGRVR